MRFLLSTTGALGLALVGGCLFPDLSEFERCASGTCAAGGADGGASTASMTTPSSSTTGGAPGSVSSGSASGGSGGAECPTSSSSGGAGTSCVLGSDMRGPSGVLNPGQFIEGRCIDDREVTWLEYATFLNDLPSDFTSPCELKSACSWKDPGKQQYTPLAYLWNDYTTSNPQGRYDDYPVSGVDWCDAATYCHWAGKELCGDQRGAPVDTDVAQWESTTEWSKACLATANFGDCNTEHTNVMHPFENDNCTKPADGTCSGTTGIRDLAGSLREWENTCDATGAPKDDTCYARGDWCFYGGTPCTLVETNGSVPKRDDKSEYIGFRCCWDAK